MRTPQARLTTFVKSIPLLLSAAAGLGALTLFGTPIALGQGVPGGVNTFSGEVPPATPANVRVTPMLDGGYRVTWDDSSFEEGGYEIERSPAFAERTRRVNANVLQTVDTQLLPVARYRVRTVGRALRSDWSPWVEERAVAASHQRLTPGRGFTAPTPVPAPVGTSGMLGYDAKAIARWNVVPFQTFSGNFVLGVVAFHMNGIDRVEFSANGGPWVPVREMKLNPLSGTVEYTALLRAADFRNGPVEVRAVVYPREAGVARVLGGQVSAVSSKSGEHSLLLAADPRGRLGGPPRWVDPVHGDDGNDGLARTSAARTLGGAVRRVREARGTLDAATILLLEGDHDWMSFTGTVGNNSFASIRFRAAPGVSREDVRIIDRPDVTGNAPRILLVEIAGVTVSQTIRDTTFAGSGENQLWFDACDFDAGSLTATYTQWVSSEWERGVYLTNCSFGVGRVAVNGVHLARNIEIEHCGEDAFKNVGAIINARVHALTQAHSSYHPDVVQYLGEWTNTIVYGLTAINFQAQSIFSREPTARHDDAAFVNVILEPTNTSYLGQWLRNTNHLLVWHWTSNSPFWFRSTNPGDGALLTVTNLSVRNSVFASVSYPTERYPPASAAFLITHFVSGTAFGQGSSNGAISGSAGARIIDGRVDEESLVVPIDVNGSWLVTPASIGATQPVAGRP